MIHSFIMLLITIVVLSILKYNKNIFSNNINNKKRYYILITILVIVLLFIIDFINTFVILVHLIIFLFIYKILFLIIEKISKKHYNNIPKILTLITTILYLSYGIYSLYNVVPTNYTILTNKNIGVDNLRIVQISDAHIGTTFNGEQFSKYTTKINNLNPDIVVITGDFVDDKTKRKDMIKSIENMAKINTKYGIYFIFGNHDRGYFNYRDFSAIDLKIELVKNNIIILEDASILINENILLIGRQDKSIKTRKNIEDLIIMDDKYTIVLDHQPNDYKNESNANIDLVLSGHSHGGQLIPIGPLSVLIKANDSYYGKKIINNTTFIVNSGISNWALRYKTGAISEYGIIDIKSK